MDSLIAAMSGDHEEPDADDAEADAAVAADEMEEEEAELADAEEKEEEQAELPKPEAAQKADAKGLVMGKGVAAMAKKKVLAESPRRHDFDRMLAEGKVVEAQRTSYISGDMKKFAELSFKTKFASVGTGLVPADDLATDGQDKIMTLAEAMVKDGKVKTLGEGISAALRGNSKLRAKYEDETALG
jgi:hypothetical protein